MIVEQVQKHGIKTGIYVLRDTIHENDMKFLRDVIDKQDTFLHMKKDVGQNVSGKTFLIDDINDSDIKNKVEEITRKTLDGIMIAINNCCTHLAKTKVNLNDVSNLLPDIGFRRIDEATDFHIDGPFGIPTDDRNKQVELSETRFATLIISLNSDFNGGELLFPVQKFSKKLSAGEAILFPPSWTHPHGTDELEGYRYTLNMWLTM